MIFNNAEAPSQAQLIDFLAAYWKIVGKFKWKIVSFAIANALVVAIFVAGLSPTYRATASVLIKAEQEKAVSIEDVYTLDTSRKEYFLTHFEILKSRAIASAVIQKISLDQHPEFAPKIESSFFKKLTRGLKTLILNSKSADTAVPDKQETKLALDELLLENQTVTPVAENKLGFIERIQDAILSTLPKPPEKKVDVLEQKRKARVRLVNQFSKRLHVKPVRNTQLVKISFDAKDPRLAALVANATGEAYIEQQMETKLQVTKKAVDWLGTRLGQLRTKLDESELRLQAFRKKENLIDLEGVSSIVADELADLSNNYREARKRRVQAESIYLLVNDNNNSDYDRLSGLAEISEHPIIAQIKKSEIEAEKKISELSQRYGPKHPKMISAQAELAVVQQNLHSQIEELVAGIATELASAKDREYRLAKQMESAKREYQSVSTKEAEYLQVKREVQANSNLYNTFLARFKETDVATNFQAQQARIVDQAEIPLRPIKPKKGLIVVLSFIVALMLAVVFVFILDALNDKFRNSSEVESTLGLRLIGLTPALMKEKNKALSVHAFFDEQYQSFAESVRTLRTGIVLSHLDKESMVLAVTSSLPGEGKTTTAINMAFSMAQVEKTLLIEADMRKPSFTRLFPNLPPYQEGLSNVIAGTSSLEECIVRDEKSGLDLLTAGQIPPNPLELLSSNKFADLLVALKSKYKHIIIDTAPTNLVSDPLVVSRLADSVVYVVKHNGTRHKVAKQGIGRLLEVEAKIDGVILNNVDMSKTSEYSYQSYEGYGEFVKS